jgi:hypothetical protein
MATPSPSSNPFHFGKVVSGNDFCPRPELENLLRAKIRQGQNILAQGPRRTGKTSILRQVAGTIPRYTEVYVDLFGVRTLEEFVQRFAHGVASVENSSRWGRALAAAFSFIKVSFSKAGMSVEIRPHDAAKMESIDEIVDFLAKHRNARWVVIIDEFQEILKAPESAAIQGRLRSRIQFLKATPFVFAGSSRNQMQNIFNHPGSPLYKSAETIDIGPIARPTFTAWLGSRFALGGRTVPSPVLENAIEMAADVPGDVQQLCAALWEETAPGEVVAPDKLGAALGRIWEQEQRSNEAIVAGSSRFQLRYLTALAHNREATPSSKEFLALVGNAQSASVFKAFQTLEKEGILQKTGAHFAFTNPFFREWLKMRFPKP